MDIKSLVFQARRKYLVLSFGDTSEQQKPVHTAPGSSQKLVKEKKRYSIRQFS